LSKTNLKKREKKRKEKCGESFAHRSLNSQDCK